MKPVPYRYSILRYVHDVRTEEFLNVAVLFQMQEKGLLQFRATERTGRLTGAFPGINAEAVIHSLRRYAEEFARVKIDCAFETIERARSVVLPKDDSSFQWGATAGGLTDDLGQTFESVFQRYVGRYEKKLQKKVRSDADVWQVLKAELDQRQITRCLHRADIKTPLREYRFQHTWQNHQLHALKPFSLDGESPEDIADKTAQWVGVMHDLFRSMQPFRLHLVIGHSQHAEMQSSYDSARDLLKESAQGVRAEVHDEAEIPQLADRIADDLKDELRG